ncbi:MAG: 50S ribosomal protein L22 [Chloroflexi bacterium]|nr:50S ribosomal protein L22 [Chloroflexota bacterium]MBI3732554.1 50S ribosomal protein L22 [Chloroflexota bacterium]
MEVRAVEKYIGMSPFKVRLVTNAVKGKQVDEALTQLKFMSKAAADPVAKAIKSAAANAEENFALNRQDLYITRIQADEGPLRKWRRFGARGRFKPILKRSSHITVVLGERESSQK